MIDRSPLTSTAAHVAFGLLLSFGLMGSMCKKDEEPPPMPSATAEPTVAAPAVLTFQEETDAGADADADKPRGTGAPAQSLKNCCTALKQNAAGAPDPMKSYMMAAAGACDAAVASGADRNAAMGGIRAALGGAALPAACF
ncbi:MAG TPA: acyltransferase [Polyangiaceae bacterium]|nr:acyltransferase [Polyangiaceae bacterium]